MAQHFKLIGLDNDHPRNFELEFEDAAAAIAFAEQITRNLAQLEPLLDFSLVVVDEDGGCVFERHSAPPPN